MTNEPPLAGLSRKAMDQLFENAVDGDPESVARITAAFAKIGVDGDAHLLKVREMRAPLIERERRIAALRASMSADGTFIGFLAAALSQDAFEDIFVEQLAPPLSGAPGREWIAFRKRCQAGGVRMTYASLAEWSGLSPQTLKNVASQAGSTF